jgi:hypothetical protein
MECRIYWLKSGQRFHTDVVPANAGTHIASVDIVEATPATTKAF